LLVDALAQQRAVRLRRKINISPSSGPTRDCERGLTLYAQQSLLKICFAAYVVNYDEEEDHARDHHQLLYCGADLALHALYMSLMSSHGNIVTNHMYISGGTHKLRHKYLAYV
jgi:hypothetical protein